MAALEHAVTILKTHHNIYEQNQPKKGMFTTTVSILYYSPNRSFDYYSLSTTEVQDYRNENAKKIQTNWVSRKYILVYVGWQCIIYILQILYNTALRGKGMGQMLAMRNI